LPPPNESDASVSIKLEMGRTSLTMREYALPSDEAYALAAVLDAVIGEVVKSRPRIVYQDQIKKLVNAACVAQVERFKSCLS